MSAYANTVSTLTTIPIRMHANSSDATGNIPFANSTERQLQKKFKKRFQRKRKEVIPIPKEETKVSMKQ